MSTNYLVYASYHNCGTNSTMIPLFTIANSERHAKNACDAFNTLKRHGTIGVLISRLKTLDVSSETVDDFVYEDYLSFDYVAVPHIVPNKENN